MVVFEVLHNMKTLVTFLNYFMQLRYLSTFTRNYNNIYFENWFNKAFSSSTLIEELRNMLLLTYGKNPFAMEDSWFGIIPCLLIISSKSIYRMLRTFGSMWWSGWQFSPPVIKLSKPLDGFISKLLLIWFSENDLWRFSKSSWTDLSCGFSDKCAHCVSIMTIILLTLNGMKDRANFLKRPLSLPKIGRNSITTSVPKWFSCFVCYLFRNDCRVSHFTSFGLHC